MRLGTAVPFWSCIWILTAAYVGACGYSVVMASMAQPAGTSLALSAAPASLSLVPALPVKTLVSVASVESVAAAASGAGVACIGCGAGCCRQRAQTCQQPALLARQCNCSGNPCCLQPCLDAQPHDNEPTATAAVWQ